MYYSEYYKTCTTSQNLLFRYFSDLSEHKYSILPRFFNVPNSQLIFFPSLSSPKISTAPKCTPLNPVSPHIIFLSSKTFTTPKITNFHPAIHLHTSQYVACGPENSENMSRDKQAIYHVFQVITPPTFKRYIVIK